MDQYEKSIREKVYAAKILTPGEWVYLVGLFQLAKESEAPKQTWPEYHGPIGLTK